MRTLDQQRAAHAWKAVQRAKAAREGAHNGQGPKKFGSQAKKLPTRIMAAGLGQALAFLEAKKYAPGLVFELSDWVLRERLKHSNASSLVRAVIDGDAGFIRQATDEALTYLGWLTRFAEAEGLTDDEGPAT